MKRVFLSLIVAVVIVGSIIFTKNAANATDPNVSVLLKEDIQNVSAISFSVKGTFKESYSNKTLTAGKKYTVKKVSGELRLYDGSKLILKGKTLSLRPTSVSVSNLTTLYGKVERTYLGTMKFTIENSTYIRPVNIIPIEEYVKGVVPGEMNSSYHMHALRAQAIAARSYVTYALSKKRSINDTASFQRYVGYHKGYNDSIKAAFETRGKVLTYKGQTIEALYSASNGGFTETNVGAWPSMNTVKLPYYPAKADPYDNKQSWNHSFYKKQISLTGLDLKNPDKWWGNVTEKDVKLTEVLKKSLVVSGQTIKILDITSFNLTNLRTDGKRIKQSDFNVIYILKNSSGKVVKDTKGEVKRISKKITITPDQLKYGLSMRSKYVGSVKTTTILYQLTVLGNGHGVGMSQTGAGVMANKGKGFREILAFYYPGTVIKNDKTNSTPTTAIQLTGTINYEGVNIRKSPSTSAAKVTSGKLGQSATILGKTGVWFKIKVGALTGYINEEYVNVHQSISYKNGITPITSGKIQYLGAPIKRENNTLYVPMSGLAKRYGMKYNYYTSSQNIIIMNGTKKVVAP
jgi:stage II sporulation protein D